MVSKEESPNEKHASPKKRRKVNHACVYCRRSHMTCDLDRPCARCLKRGIPHLCHDEQPGESVRGIKHAQPADGASVKQEEALPYTPGSAIDQQQVDEQLQQGSMGTLASDVQRSAAQMSSVPISQSQQGLPNDIQQYPTYNDWTFGSQNQFQDMHSLHPSYMFNAPDINDEYNLLNEFLTSSLLDDPTVFPNDESKALNSDQTLDDVLNVGRQAKSTLYAPESPQNVVLGPDQAILPSATSFPRSKSDRPSDKQDDKYYMTIADPSSNDTSEERMNEVFTAKYNAGLLRPFNYIQGYARLHRYMDQNMQPASRQRILRQLDKFRPKFRERMQSLTDMELTFVEMWFERSLMEYDRVFASMAIPACCWRRTGEIFRGNKEMAELIHVPIEELRDGKLALHDIVVEKDLVSYWDKFLAIAFDNSQKAMLTTCSLKCPHINASDPEIKCCFSFTIRRDNHNIPSLIVGNFLPQIPRKP